MTEAFESDANVKRKIVPFVLCVLAIYLGGLACARGTPTRSFSHAEFRFEYPSAWQTMSELWGTHQLQANYYGLEAEELAALTSVRKRGEMGIWFSVAKRPLDDTSLSALVENLYTNAQPAVADLERSTRQVGGQEAITVRYRRPWGEPWWEFYDLWLEKDGSAFLLSFHALSLDSYTADIDLILQSFSFQP